jgi:hypothetical protein
METGSYSKLDIAGSVQVLSVRQRRAEPGLRSVEKDCLAVLP